ncbi:DNA helicase Pif1-like [Trinorchestia longiramus]|nr:DNA helicase Pif1-like [Trinorchestia longiramus]
MQKLEAVARAVRNTDKPFGGIQLIVCGDFLQLPPVSRSNSAVFAFQTPAWQSCIQRTVELTTVRRQNDDAFIELLQQIRMGRSAVSEWAGQLSVRMGRSALCQDGQVSSVSGWAGQLSVRMGRCSEEHAAVLRATAKNELTRDGIQATRLCTHREDVSHINSQQLDGLPGQVKLFTATDSDSSAAKILDAQTPVLARLHLKVGAQVMLMKNLAVGEGLVNGSRGVVESFAASGNPVVKFACGVRREVGEERWSVRCGGGQVTRRQLPLKLAWAFSIHKSQGMTLDLVEMSLSRVFEAGQAYVALSRARNLAGLRVLDFSASCIRANTNVLKYYKNLVTR